jgi:hypothetical protein
VSATGDERDGEQEGAGGVREVIWELNPAQWAFVYSPARFSFYVGGVGAGKTFAGAARAVLRMIEDPGSLGLIGAPTYPMLRDATLRAFLELLPRPLIHRTSAPRSGWRWPTAPRSSSARWRRPTARMA